MKRNYTIAVAILAMLLTVNVSAQKFGYINSQQLIQQIPQVKEANAELETIRSQYEKQGQDKVTALKTKYAALERKQAQGEIAPKQLEAEAATLKNEELEIAKFEQDMQTVLRDKSEELLKPIRDKIQAAIDAVAAEEGFQYIFDQSMGILLYADEATDVSAKVKAKLGM
ncbi:MAG: OmpH family outer membrane protein [Bacteroidota bacterium]